MSLTSLRRAIAAWISPDDDATIAEIADLNATIKTLKEQNVASAKEAADSRAALAPSVAALAAAQGTISSLSAQVAADEAEFDAEIASNANVKGVLDATVAALPPATPPAA